MWLRQACAAVGAVAALVAGAGSAAAQASDSLPSGVTSEMVSRGRRLFHGPALCRTCHGENGRGSVGPNLGDDEWLHSGGSYEEIVRQVQSGVPPDQSQRGIFMPPRGGGNLTDDQVRAVAAYVWSLRRTGAGRRSRRPDGRSDG